MATAKAKRLPRKFWMLPLPTLLRGAGKVLGTGKRRKRCCWESDRKSALVNDCPGKNPLRKIIMRVVPWEQFLTINWYAYQNYTCL